MTSSACRELSSVELLHERRLAIADRTRLEEHLAGCDACRRELLRLRQLSSALRELPVTVDELALRRQRHALLAAAGAPQERRGRRERRTILVACACFLGAVAAFALWSRFRMAPSARSTQPSRSDVSVVALNDTHWSRYQEGTVERIELMEGELSLQIRRDKPGRRLLVAVPDGVIEDIGTRFVVNVGEGRVRWIRVTEGSVVFHRSSGQGAVRIDAPSTWHADQVALMPPRLAPSDEPQRKSEPTKVQSTAPSAPSRPPSVPSVQASSTSAQLADALSLIRSGQAALAIVKLQAFLASRPRDPRAEDAAYLLVIAQEAAGDRVRAVDAAREYLVRFPDGFRRREVERVLGR